MEEEEEEEASSALPPQGVDPLDDSSSSHVSESPIKLRPGTKPGSWKAQSKKKLRQSAGQASKQRLDSLRECGQQPVTLEDLANMTALRKSYQFEGTQPRGPSLHMSNSVS